MSVTFSHGFKHDMPLYHSLRDLQTVSSDLRGAYQGAAVRKVHVTPQTPISCRGNLASWVAQEDDDPSSLLDGWEKVELVV